MNNQRGEELIRDLLEEPSTFNDRGRAYELLQEYFAALPVETLRPLLRSDNIDIQRSAAFIASELGGQARSLVDDVIPLLRSPDGHVAWYAMETLTVCCEGEHALKFGHVARMLESDVDVLRRLAMRLLSKADTSQLEGARQFFEAAESPHAPHGRALSTLVAGDRAEPSAVASMIRDADPLIRRYGAIAAQRLHEKFPNLMREVSSSDDADLCKFHQGIGRIVDADPQTSAS